LPDGYLDPTANNDTSTDTDTLGADLSITKTDGVTTYSAGGTNTYTVTVTNVGNVDVSGATVTDAKPANILNWAWACTSLTGGVTGCTPAGSGTSDFSNTVDLPVGGSIVYTVTANIVENPTGALVNTASVTLPASLTDQTPENNSSTDTDTIGADLSITKTDGVTTYSADGTNIYTITVTNVGNVDISGATVADLKPANILNWAWACTSQSGGATGCLPAASGTSDFNETVTLPVGGSIVYSVTAHIVKKPTGDLVNTATITLPAGYSDPTPGNNTSTDTDTLYVKPASLPNTGFAPDRVTKLPQQAISYADLGDLWLEIPRLGVRIPIVGVPQVNGTWDISWLGSQAGWLNGTAYPSSAGDSVLTGHVYDAFGQPGPFVHLNGLWYGDQIIVHAGAIQYVYEVREVLQVAPDAISSVIKHEDLPWVTLITCRGYDEASNSYKYRVAVRAVLVQVK
jgi:LPXTG-site transpeptidase (sortase) family protein